ncbi:MAG: 50S ribosomal protein L6 [Deltaproteobacteria bacterium RIFCSPLOWO2_02_FULL_53_8]|nr:MAG: 50S ribosomal protein L6 [Deltaproteobacteria bacterium RIFCSPLOWO2_02_FULL_53_8]
MSRIGKLPITVPQGVKMSLEGRLLKVSGAQGKLEFDVRPEIKVDIKDNVIQVSKNEDTRMASNLFGLTRTLIANMVKGVSEGFVKRLDIIGVGFKADVQGNIVNLALGFSHPVKYELPSGVSATVEKQTGIILKGPDKQLIGQVAANIRSFRPPEPYKGKGIKYSDEVVRRKAGKAGKASGGK